jgi:imidazolonepropionase-like amidohydrolase
VSELLLRNARVLDVDAGDYVEGDLRCVDGVVAESGTGLAAGRSAVVLALDGAAVLPGLIDAHAHVTLATADIGMLNQWSPTYVTAHAVAIMGRMLDRGFTTVRDAGGADFGLADAQAEGLVRGPRLAFCGRPISQTGGHADTRSRGDDCPCPRGYFWGGIADGVDAVRVAARNELRKGAHHLKLMAGGGVASPTDRIDSTQFSLDELRAAVEEATAANRYVAAHAYTAEAVSRALNAGVRSIEHGNLIDESNVQQFRDHDAFLVPTLVTYWALKREGIECGLPEANWRKVDQVLHSGLEALERAHAGGVKIAFGTDLLGGMHRHQNEEFRIRRQVQQPLDIIRSATTVAAELLGMSGRIGTLAVGAHADLIVVDGDPLDDIAVLAEPGHIRHIVQGGHVVRSRN